MYWRHLGICLGVFALSNTAFAQNQQRSYPTVIGVTGQPYGFTQAEYQYQNRYGRPSPGSNGGGLQYVNGYPGGGYGHGGRGFYGGYNPFLFMDVGPYIAPPTNGYVYYPSTAYYGLMGNTNFGYPYVQPYLGPATAPSLQFIDPASTGIFNYGGGATYNQFTSPMPTQYPSITNSTPVIPQSTPKALETSFEYQTQGDLQLQQLNYMTASERYRKSIDAARDRADPRYRMAITLAARSRFLEAVDQIKLATQIDPTWPQRADSLDQVFGNQNTFEKTRVKQRVAEWTLQDARDPNRLLLLGALLYMDGDPNAKTMFDTAILIAGKQDYLVAFTTPRPLDSNPGAVLQQAPIAQPPAPGLSMQNGAIIGNEPQPVPAKPPVQQAPVGGNSPLKESPIPSLPPAIAPSLPGNGSSNGDDQAQDSGEPLPNSNGNTGKNGPSLPPLPAP